MFEKLIELFKNFTQQSERKKAIQVLEKHGLKVHKSRVFTTSPIITRANGCRQYDIEYIYYNIFTDELEIKDNCFPRVDKGLYLLGEL